jgi:peroxiredoxin
MKPCASLVFIAKRYGVWWCRMTKAGYTDMVMEGQLTTKQDKGAEGANAGIVPLSARLAAVADDLRLRHVDYTKAMDALVARLSALGAGKSSPAVGDIFPDVILPDATGKLWHLASALKEGPVVVCFHRGYWCDFCIINMTALVEINHEVQALGGQIVAISPENAEQTACLAADAGTTLRVLCDMGLGVATLLGLTYVVDDDFRRELAKFDVDITKGNGGSGWILPLSATFVLDATGRVVVRHVDPDPRTRMDPVAIVQAVAKCQSAARS